MDMTAWLLRQTPPRPLVLTAPGGTAARVAVERAVRERGWRPALSPAEANILIVAGHGLDPYAERVWQAMPAPRTRLTLTTTDVSLDAAVAELRDAERQRAHATPPHQHTPTPPASHPAPPADHMDPADHGHHTDHGDHAHHMADGDHGEHGHHMDHGEHGHDMAGMDHGEHGHHMAGMDMPGGVPMADRAEDRDGLKLDQLHLPLGPALPLWPAGLIVHTRLQGDVVQEATVETLDSPGESFWSTVDPAARRLDSCAQLLALAGWTDAATIAQRLRDDTLDGTPPNGLLRSWTGRVRRSRTLRWLLAGVGTTPEGDALSRLHRWLDPAREPDSPQETQRIVDALPTMLAGAELANARLIVASLDPDLDLLPHHHEAHHG